MTVAVVIIDTDERSGEGKCLAVGYKKGGVYDPCGRECQPCHEQCASEDAHCRSEDKLLEVVCSVSCSFLKQVRFISVYSVILFAQGANLYSIAHK